MWHTIEDVARYRHIDVDFLKRFAIKNQEKFGIVARIQVATCFVDQLVKEAKKALELEDVNSSVLYPIRGDD